MRTIEDLGKLLLTKDCLIRQGYTDYGLRTAIRQGHITRLRQGVYIGTQNLQQISTWERYPLQILAQFKSAPSTVFSHQSAAVLHGLALIRMNQQKIHLYCKPSSRGYSPETTRHALLQESTPLAVTPVGAITTDIPTLLLDCARTLPFEEAVVIADSALYAQKISLTELYILLRSFQGRGAAKAYKVAENLSYLSESPGETLTRMRLSELGIRFRQQEPVVLGSKTYRGDFYLIDFDCFVEFDGNMKYSDFGSPEVAIANERARERQFLNSGARIFRTDWSEVFSHPERFENRLKVFLRKISESNVHKKR